MPELYITLYIYNFLFIYFFHSVMRHSVNQMLSIWKWTTFDVHFKCCFSASVFLLFLPQSNGQHFLSIWWTNQPNKHLFIWSVSGENVHLPVNVGSLWPSVFQVWSRFCWMSPWRKIWEFGGVKRSQGHCLLQGNATKGGGWFLIVTSEPSFEMLRKKEHFYDSSCFSKQGSTMFNFGLQIISESS